MHHRTDTTHGTQSAAARGLARLFGAKTDPRFPISAEANAKLQASHVRPTHLRMY